MASDHLQAVAKWLNDNCHDATNAQEFVIQDVRINAGALPRALRGSFHLRIDSFVFPAPFEFHSLMDQAVDVYVPLFVSPLGAPASYAQVDLPEGAVAAIAGALQQVLPPVCEVTADDATPNQGQTRVAADCADWEWESSNSEGALRVSFHAWNPSKRL